MEIYGKLLKLTGFLLYMWQNNIYGRDIKSMFSSSVIFKNYQFLKINLFWLF